MFPRAHLPLLLLTLSAIASAPVPARAASSEASEAIAAFLVAEATAGDLNGDGDALDAVVHLVEPRSGATQNLGLAVPMTCDAATVPPRCSAAQPVVGDATVAFVVSERAQGGTDLTADGDAVDDVVFVYDARQREVLSTGVAVAHGTTRSVSIMNYAFAPVIVGDAVVFLVSERDQGMTDLTGDGDTIDAVVHVMAAHSHKIFGVGVAAPRIGAFSSPVFDAVGDGKHVTVLVGEPDQGRDLNGDGDADDLITMDVQVQSGTLRLAE